MGEADEPTNGRRAWTGSRRSMCKPDVHTNLEDGRLDSHAVFGAALATFSSPWRSNPIGNALKTNLRSFDVLSRLKNPYSLLLLAPTSLPPPVLSLARVPGSISIVPGTPERSDTAIKAAEICPVEKGTRHDANRAKISICHPSYCCSISCFSLPRWALGRPRPFPLLRSSLRRAATRTSRDAWCVAKREPRAIPPSLRPSLRRLTRRPFGTTCRGVGLPSHSRRSSRRPTTSMPQRTSTRVSAPGLLRSSSRRSSS